MISRHHFHAGAAYGFRAAFVLLVFCALWLACPANAKTADGCSLLKGKTIRWIVPFSAGGGYDVYSRLLAPYLERRLGARIKIDNISGGGGMVGGRTIMQAAPDGLTLGLINSPGTLNAAVTGVANAPDPARDFSILGRLAHGLHILVTGAKSSIKNMDDVLALSVEKPVVFGISGVGGISFLVASMVSHILDVNTQYVAGYSGTRQTTLAAIRGEIDLLSLPFDSARGRLEAGHLRAVMQISCEPLADHPALAGVPVLAGPDGLAVLRAKRLGRSPAEAASLADALVALTKTGRLVVAPAGLKPVMADCLSRKFKEAMADPAFLKAAAKAKRPIDPADAGAAHATVVQAMAKASSFVPIVRAAMEKVRK